MTPRQKTARQTTARQTTARQKTARQTSSASYEVGYGKPPRHTQFRKGQSGNPGGRPRRGKKRERMKALALQEAYRSIAVKEDGRTVEVPAIQAILRSQVRLAAKGNVQAQRAVLAAIEAFEHSEMEEARIAAERQPINYNDAARRITLLLRLAKQEQEEERRKQEEAENRRKGQAEKRDAGPPASAGGPAQPEDSPGQAVPPAAPPMPQPPPAPWREPPVDRQPAYARHPARERS